MGLCKHFVHNALTNSNVCIKQNYTLGLAKIMHKT